MEETRAKEKAAMARRWPLRNVHGEVLRNVDAVDRDVSDLGRTGDGRMKSSGHSKRKNVARKAARAARRRNR